ncbi:hypothetical protein, partial [Pseudomonas syringae]|uniref:hypothetical protein n=1 Tax=Pseudomonas syringae TaxID=317 RepID=UPI001CA9C8CF
MSVYDSRHLFACVVSVIAVKTLLTLVPTLRVGMHFVTLCVTRRLCDVSDVCLRLKAPFRPSATYF